MVDRNLLRELDVTDVDAEEEFDMDELLGDSRGVEAGGIVPGRVIEIVGDQVVVDVGYKSEGLVPLNEWEDGEEPAASPATRSRSCSRAWTTTPARSSSPGRRPTGCAPGSA